MKRTIFWITGIVTWVAFGLAIPSPAAEPSIMAVADKADAEAARSGTVIHKYRGEGSGWEYLSKRMEVPKRKKWVGRWNHLGSDGWELVGMSDGAYIFKRPAPLGFYMADAGRKEIKKDKKSRTKMSRRERKAAKERAKLEKKQEKAAKKAEKAAAKANQGKK